MAANDPTMAVPTPTGALQGVAAYGWDGSAWQPAGRAGPSVATPTGVLQGVAPFTWDGAAWQPSGRAGPGVATPTGVLDGVAVYTWSGSAWVPAGGQPAPSTPSGALRGVATFNWDGAAWQPAGQAGPSVATPTGVLAGVAMFNWTGSAWAAVAAPSLDLSFMTPGSLPSGIVFTRASTGTYFDATGTLQTAAANTPRWDYDPVTHVLRGLLIEEARTNSTVNSGAMATSWVPSAATIVAGVAVAPDGTTTAAKFTESNTAVAHTLASPFAPLTATQYTFSVFAKAGGRSILFATGVGMTGAGVIPQWDLSAGTDVSTGATTNFTHGIQAVGNGWYRCWFSFLSAGTAAVAYNPALVAGGTNAYLGDGVSGIFMWGAQSEIGAFLTSYIPTAAASVTRAAEVCTMPTTGWFSLTASSLASEFIVPQSPNPSTNAREICIITDGSSGNRMGLRGLSASTNIATFYSTVVGTTGSASLGAVSANSISKSAGAWNGTTPAGSLNGAAVVTYSGALPASLNVLTIGNQFAAAAMSLNGWARRVRYWPRALTNAELQSVTT